MTETNKIQHPDITAAEQTGYPWFPRKVTIEATSKHAHDFCLDSFEAFFDFLFTAYPHAISSYLDDNEDQFTEFMTCGTF